MHVERKPWWKRTLDAIGRFQYLLFTAILYFILAAPFAWVQKIRTYKEHRRGPAWCKKHLPPMTLEHCRSQGNPEA